MNSSFEVKESDLLGRVGTLKIGGRSLETPCLFPVVHPVVQAVPTTELRTMGFKGIMTNSYIIYSRRKEEAALKGVHRLVDFDGVVMTDSGGYQVLEYVDLGLGYREVAEYQAKIGSDFAVTLDAPTGYSESEEYARETMEVSLKGALRTLEEFGDGRTVWVGPVQGGLFPKLLKKSATALVRAGFSFLALGSPTQVMENYRFSELVGMISAARSAMPYSVPLHLFGAGHPLTMPLAVALGCDTFDSASYILFARRGSYMTERGAVAIRSMKFLPCSCTVCSRTSVTELLELSDSDRTRRLASHNLWLLKKEVEGCKEAIVEGRLWDLVQEKATAHPRLTDALLRFADRAEEMTVGTSQIKEKGLFVRSVSDKKRPEVQIAKRKLASAIRRSSRKALLLTSPTPPMGRVGKEPGFKGHDVYRLHPVFGPCPIELDFVYPFTHTLVSAETPSVTKAEAAKYLRKMGYAAVRFSEEKAAPRPRLRNKRKSKAASLSAPSS